MSVDVEENEIIRLTTTALELATTAVHMDNSLQLIPACDYYDKCILHLDEVLNKLPATSPEYSELMNLRTKYDDRMETLRDIEKSRFELTTLTGGSGGSGGSTAAEAKKIHRQRKKRQSLVMFEEDEQLDQFLDNVETHKFEQPPVDVLRRPYWHMRLISRAINHGEFLTPAIFIPKSVWKQLGVKFSGLHAKTSAFKTLIYLIETSVEPLVFDETEHTLNNAFLTLKSLLEELVILQNQLSKSFPFIREVQLGGQDKDTKKVSVKRKIISYHSPALVIIPYGLLLLYLCVLVLVGVSHIESCIDLWEECEEVR